jgi:hypothetical protein
MERKEFKTTINAPRTKVWQVLWDDATYPQWTSVFSEGSKAVSDWNEGSKILFLAAEGGGMLSMINKKIDNEYMSFKHVGMVDKEGAEITEGEHVAAFAGAEENYILKETDGKTDVTVELDISEQYEEMFSDMFPKALQKLKEICEQ